MEDKIDFMSFVVAFRVNNPNLRIFNNFKNYARDNTGDNYLLAIRDLMLKASILEMYLQQVDKDGIEGKSGIKNKEELYNKL